MLQNNCINSFFYFIFDIYPYHGIFLPKSMGIEEEENDNETYGHDEFSYSSSINDEKRMKKRKISETND